MRTKGGGRQNRHAPLNIVQLVVNIVIKDQCNIPNAQIHPLGRTKYQKPGHPTRLFLFPLEAEPGGSAGARPCSARHHEQIEFRRCPPGV